MLIMTESGTVYEVDGNKITRDGGLAMRQDREWLEFYFLRELALGEGMMLALQPLAEGADVTIRMTSPVVQIVEYL